jgi:flagellar biosynthetic protein FlhB
LSEDKTEAASPRRLQKAREEGNVAVSREFNLVAGLAGGLGMLSVQLGNAGHTPLLWFAHALRVQSPDIPAVTVALLHAVLPCAIASAGAAGAATLLQTGLLLNPAALLPDLGRVSPARGIKRLFSLEALMQAAKSIAKIAVLAAAFWSVIHALLPVLPLMADRQAGAMLPLMQVQIRALVMPLVGAQLLIAGADLAFVRWQHAKKLRMSHQDQRDEHKDAEGNPQMKQRLRQVARMRGRRRMMAAVANATVVVTNPTHYAVALLYERGSRAAPKVVGKGADEVAARIRELAETKRIPIVANPPLARALYRVELDTEIPAEHFRAVAEIVAYIWRLNRAGGRQGRL